MPKETGRKRVAANKKARHDYAILDTFECGMVLVGTEVKSLRAGRCSLLDAYARIRDGEVWLEHAHIPEYTQGSWTNHEPRRDRKLLMHKIEIERLAREVKEGGLSLIPLEVYFLDGKAKVEIALARGKKNYDKRADMAKRDSDKEIAKVAGRRSKGMI